jgi:type IV pilus assembly protein PilW
MKFKRLQLGLTLVELMISLSLGLLILLAAVYVILSAQVGSSLQKGMSEVQDNGNFGLRFLTYELRKANYGQVNIINDRLVHGGIVLTSANLPLIPAIAHSAYDSSNISVNIPRNISNTVVVPVSQSAMPSNIYLLSSGSDGLQKKQGESDQLVMQFYADIPGIDCEGNGYEDDRYIVQRFFLRKDENANLLKEPHDALVLACEAGWYNKESKYILKNLKNRDTLFGSTSGRILMHRVDHFHYLLGISNDQNNSKKRYIGIEDYKKLNEYPRPRINSIQIGLLVRSSENVGWNQTIPSSQEFELLDQKIKLKESNSAVSTKFLRYVITQTIAIRNGFFEIDLAEGM